MGIHHLSFQNTFMGLEELFGATLLTYNNGEQPTNEVLANKKYIMVYFSAHWCPPCRGFTPNLVKEFNDFLSLGHKHVAIVFVSSDRDKEAFEGYYREQTNFLAVPYTK